FAQLRDDGTTSCGCWIFAGSWTPAGNQIARRENADPSCLVKTSDLALSRQRTPHIVHHRQPRTPTVNPCGQTLSLLSSVCPYCTSGYYTADHARASGKAGVGGWRERRGG
ncbi:hypothetical protein, partial [Escherichia coli]|uniref:hypothetical protein n=1 Tax=Escherichia coli TaxID=562 RepID=UPI0010CC0DC3